MLQYPQRYNTLNVTIPSMLQYPQCYNSLNVTIASTLQYPQRYNTLNVTIASTCAQVLGVILNCCYNESATYINKSNHKYGTNSSKTCDPQSVSEINFSMIRSVYIV